jgi:hypothetical protein
MGGLHASMEGRMRRVVDLECVLPPDDGAARQHPGAAGHRIGEGDPELLPPLAGCSFDNHRHIFTWRQGARAGRTPCRAGADQACPPPQDCRLMPAYRSAGPVR